MISSVSIYKMERKTDLENSLKSFNTFANNGNVPNASKILKTINDYFEEQNSEVVMDLSVQLVLDPSSSTSLLSFLKKKVIMKSLKDLKSGIFELIKKLVSRYPEKVKQFSGAIVMNSTKYIEAYEVSAREKELAVQILQDIVTNFNFDNEIEHEKLVKQLMEVFDHRNPTNRFLQYTIELLGLISKKFPSSFQMEDALRLRQILISRIENIFKDTNNIPSYSVIGGVVDCLSNHLENFAPDVTEEQEVCQAIYICVKELSDPNKNNAHDKTAFRNALNLLSQHGSLISAQIFQDYVYWHKILSEIWVKRANYEERKCGIQATYRFHEELAHQIEARKNVEDKKILQYFMNNFKKSLQSSNSETFEIRIAIKGIGQMAPAYKALLPSEYLVELFDLVMERTEYSYHTKDKMKKREVLEHLPAYVESLSKIMSHITELSGIQLIALENIIIVLIKDFHFLSQYHHTLVVTALLNTFKNIQKLGGKVLNDSLEKIVMQGMIYSCSHQLVYDLRENLETVQDWKETITYKRYLPLWTRILYNPENVEISSIIYDHFIENLFRILKKLNLSTVKRKFTNAEGGDREFFFNDPSIDLEPVNPKDFMIFYNLVDFCCDIFRRQSQDCLNQNFTKWIDSYVTTMCEMSMQNPLVSGHLKLLEAGLVILGKLNYLNETNRNSKIEIVDLLVYFGRNLLTRIQESSGELQIACLCALFEMPTFILLEFLPDLPEIFVIGFNLGKLLLWIADKSLTCFEKVLNESDNHPESRKKLLEMVFPCFDGFFQGKVSNLAVPQTFSKKINTRYKRNYFKKDAMIQGGKNELQELQKKILSFLGNFDPDECLYMIADSENNQQLVQENTMIYRIRLESYEDLNPAIFLDSLIPRLCYLTQSSSDRSTKVSACELLHALVLFKMGRADTSDAEPELWRTLMEQMILLGSSSTDLTARQLFEPLLMQIMHFYSKSDRITSETTTVTVQVLYDMICHPTDSCVQDLSARLLRELILWSIKQTSVTQRSASPIKLVDIFHELKKMSINVDENRRKGAVTAFNNIYRIIREEQSLVDVYWLYLIDILCANFKMSEDLNQNFDSQENRKFEHLSASLDHLTRVVLERKDIFKINNLQRIKPKSFSGVTIEHLVVWLFQQCGSKQYNYRHKIMNDVFLRITQGAWSLNQFVEQQITLERILKVGEGGAGGIASCQDLNFVKNVKFFQFKEIHLWLEHLLTSLDFYSWIFKENIMKSDDFEGFVRDSKIFKVLTYFLEELCHNSPLDILEKINESSLNTSQMSLEFTATKELDNLKNIKSLIIVKILDFANVLLTKQNILDQFLLENHQIFIKLLVDLIFRPQYYECKKIDRELEGLLKSLLFSAPDIFRKRLIETLSNELADNMKTLTSTCGKQMEENHVNTRHFNMMSGIKLIVKNYKDYSSYFPQSANELFKNSAELLLLNLYNGLNDPNQSMKCLSSSAKSYVKIAFEISTDIEDLLQKIVDFCLEDKLLKKSSSISIKHGEYFLEIFKAPIFELFAQRIEDSLEFFLAKMDSNNCLVILDILTKFNDFVFKQKSSGDDEILKINIEATFKKWDKIFEWSQTVDNSNLALINFVMHLAITCPIDLHLLGENLVGFKQWLLDIIASSKNSLELKSKAISLLPCITSSNDKIDEDLSKCLLALQQKHFPMKSNEFKEDSLERAGLVSIMEKLLNSLIYSRSPVILKFLIEATISDDNHIMEQKISESLKEFMMQNQDAEQKFINQYAFDFFLNEKYDPLIRLNVVTRFLLVLLRSSSVDVMLYFFQQNIRKIHTLLQSSYSSIDGRGYYVQQAFINRSGAYLLIEAFAAVLPKQKINDNQFNCMGKTMTGKEVLDDLIKKSKAVRDDIYVVQNDIQSIEMFRKYQCYAYRALCALLSNTKDNVTQNTLDLFNVCLFKENTAKNQYVWQKIIDIQNDHLYSDFTQDFEEYPKTKQFIVSIKETLETMQTDKEANSKYLRSISVFESSLSQSLTKTDLNYSIVYSKQELQQKELQDMQEERQKTLKISLESTPINDHEIMSVLVGVVNHMFGIKLTPTHDVSREKGNIPKWVQSLASSLNDHLQHKNVKMFLAKLIENCRQHFKHYACVFMEPLMRLIVHRIAGDQLNFFITDLVAMLLSWNDIYKPKTSEEILLARRLLEFMMENAYHERREIFKMNLEIVKKLVELWRDVLTDIDLSDKILVISLESQSVSQIECRIQLNAVLLANKLTPWGSNSSNKINFLKSIIKCCEHENAKVHNSASQLLGMCLQVLITTPPEQGDENHLILESIYQMLDKLQKNKSSDFLGILYGVHKNFPLIVDKYLTFICFHLPNSIKKIKSIMLEMFLSRLEIYGDEIYRQLNAIGLEMCLKDKSYNVLALHIINKSLAYVKPTDVGKLLEQIYRFSESSEPECKCLFYEILLFIMEKFKDHLEDPRKPIRYLLKGLIDTDLETHNRVLAFFAKDEILSKNFNERFLALLKDFYDPSLEKEFLHYASFLLLEISVKHPRSSRTLLDYDPRTAINYFEYQVSTKLSTQSIPPMFLETQQKQLLAGDGSQMQDLIIATQNNNNFFEPTQDPSKLSQVPQSFSLKETQNSLYFNLEPQYLDKRSQKMTQNEVLSQEEAIAEAKSRKADAFDYLRIRVIRDEKRSAKNQAARVIEYRQFANARNEANLEKKKDGNVVLYRRYRVGDFPDFYFNSLAILLPLQSLVKKDDKIGRAVFLSIFNSILDIFQEAGAEDADKEFFDSINKSIVSILETMKTYDSFLFSTLMELVLKSRKYLKISPDIIVAVTGMNNMFVTGILFLESQINLLSSEEDESTGEEPTSSKRMRIDEKEQKKFHWIKLTELYYSLSEYEIISGIFTEKLDLNLDVKKNLNLAIEYESDGNYMAASNLYSDIINEKLYRDYAERDFYYQSHYNCLINLGDWNEINGKLGKQLNKYQEIWSDRFNTDVLLPLIMKSELRQIMAGRPKQSFLDILEEWQNVEDHNDYLHANFGEEMMLLMMCSDEIKKSCVEAEQTLKQFAVEWSYLDSLLEKLRVGKLMNARNVAELWNFNTTIFQEETVTAPGVLKLMKLWKRSKPKESDSLVVWDTIISYRKYLFGLTKSSMEDSEMDLSELKNSLIETQLNLLNVALHQKNLTYAKNLWIELDKSLKTQQLESQSENLVKLEICASKLHALKADIIKIGSETSGEELATSVFKKSNCLYTAWYNLRNSYEKIGENSSAALQVEILEQLGAVSYGFLKLMPHINNHPQPQNLIHNLLSCMGSEDDQNIDSQLVNHSFKCFRKAKDVAESVLSYDSISFSKNREKEKIIGDAYLKLGKFCYNIYKDENHSTGINANLQKEIIVSVIRAIDHDSEEAKLFIPCVLQLEDLKNNKLTVVFDEEIETIPEWIFLGYISQILSNFDFENDSYLDTLIHRIANKYPRALYFPFKMSYDHYKRSPDRGMQKQLIPILNELIDSPLMKNFVDGIMRLCLPMNIVDFHFKHLRECLDDQSISDKMFKDEVQHVIDLLYENNRYSGEEFHTIASYEDNLKSIKSLIKLPGKRPAIKEELNRLIKVIDKQKVSPDSIELHRLCKWLSEYKWLGTQHYLELPGQYTGNSKPFVESHVKIVRFESRLKVFMSKQHPIELKMHGSDGRTYKCIVKYGEDLRQDQRIQQILKLMSDRLQMDKNCKLNRLKVHIYQVTPINYYCGILSVVEDTITVREFAKKCSSSTQMDPTDVEAMIMSVRSQYKKFMQEIAPNLQREEQVYGLAVQRLPKELIREKFQSMESCIPANVLKINLERNAASVETFYILRKNFINSLAAMNICHWILGVGDRHLLNILIEKKTGILIGIDFGLAFGAATRNLPIPEMFPFRLTSHFVNVLEPMRISGLIRKNMMHTLRCLRYFSDTILIALTMFTKEPTIDWLKEAKRIYSSSSPDGSGNAVLEWNPETRVKIAERKLTGANCRKITADELSSGLLSVDKKILDGYLNILNGEENDVRAVMPDEGLTVEEQVSCLIDQATDPCILGVTYRGWDPWF